MSARRKLRSKKAKRGRMARNKGVRGEQEVVNLAKEYGFPNAARGGPLQAASGSEGDYADVVNVGRLWVESRMRKALNVSGMMAEFLATERSGFVRAMFHRRDRGPWLATLEAAELLKLEAEHGSLMDAVVKLTGELDETQRALESERAHQEIA